MDSPPSILIEPPEDDNQQLIGDQDFSTSPFPVHPLPSIAPPHFFESPADEDLFNDLSFNFPNTSTEPSHDFTYPATPSSIFLNTNIAFSSYRSQPSSPNSPLSDGFPDDDYLNIDCPSPGALSDSSYTSGSPYPSTPLSESLSNFQLPDFSQSPRMRSLSDVGQNATISPGDIFGLQARSYNVPLGPPLEDSLSPYLNQFPNPRLLGHRSMLSEPNIPTNSLLMQTAAGGDTQQQLHIQTDTGRHYRSYSESNDLLSPEAAQTRGRREGRGRSRSQSRRSSPYTVPNTSQESLCSATGGLDIGGGDFLHPRPMSRHVTPTSDSASYPGTPSISQASSSSHDLASSSTSIMVMNSGNYKLSDLSSINRMAPRKVGSEKLDEASNKRRKNEAKHYCPVCSKALTTKHNVKNHMKSHFNIKDWICVDCGKGFTTGHVLKRHLKVFRIPSTYARRYLRPTKHLYPHFDLIVWKGMLTLIETHMQ
ncbi:hypothetical protein APHAL10511_007635 [Amanita phalloides]|nr:hypothetical protein APHAL10511_007635 [Amanita phalloides]